MIIFHFPELFLFRYSMNSRTRNNYVDSYDCIPLFQSHVAGRPKISSQLEVMTKAEVVLVLIGSDPMDK